MSEKYVVVSKHVRNESVGMFRELETEFSDSRATVQSVWRILEERISDIMAAAYKAGHETAEMLGPAEEWSNRACLGYVIAGAKRLEMTDKKIQELVNVVRGEFDWKTIDEAATIYNKSPY